MGGSKKIRCKDRLLQPGRGGEEGRNGEKQRKAEEHSAEKAEERAEEAVEKAEANGGGGVAQNFGEQIGSDHGGGKDEKEGGELGDGGSGDEAGEGCAALAIKPAGEEKTADNAGEGEGFRDKAAHGRTHDGVDENDAEDPVEWAHEVGAAWGGTDAQFRRNEIKI